MPIPFIVVAVAVKTAFATGVALGNPKSRKFIIKRIKKLLKDKKGE